MGLLNEGIMLPFKTDHTWCKQFSHRFQWFQKATSHIIIQTLLHIIICFGDLSATELNRFSADIF